jgi:hypothetical protein
VPSGRVCSQETTEWNTATEEIPMTTISRNVQQRAAAKEERARDAALAIREYEAESVLLTARPHAFEHYVWRKKQKPILYFNIDRAKFPNVL